LPKDRIAIQVTMTSPANALNYIEAEVDNVFVCQITDQTDAVKNIKLDAVVYKFVLNEKGKNPNFLQN